MTSEVTRTVESYSFRRTFWPVVSKLMILLILKQNKTKEEGEGEEKKGVDQGMKSNNEKQKLLDL